LNRNERNRSDSGKGRPDAAPGAYAASGVSREEGYRTVDLIRGVVGSFSDTAAAEIGAFAALHPIPGVDDLLLGAATDGVGTKIEIALRYGAYREVGQDCVAMCVNDLACHGVQPLFFLDYLACDTLTAETASQIVAGVAAAAHHCGATLIGGETAEMPGVYTPGSYDIAGFAVGTVRRGEVIDRSLIRGDEVLLAVPSSGVHSNGFSLVRSVLPDLEEEFEGRPLWQTLVTPTALYPPVVRALREGIAAKGDTRLSEAPAPDSPPAIRGIAHITGGGLYENVPRILPEGMHPEIDKASIRTPSIFRRIADAGVPEEEMYHTFNMGVGLVVAVDPDAVETVTAILPDAYPIGVVASGGGPLVLR